MNYEKPTAYFQYAVYVKCPHCDEPFDLIDSNNHDNEFSNPIFSNQWGKLEGAEVECDHCERLFKIKEVVY